MPRPNQHNEKRNGFTLIELLVVISIISLLSVFVLSSFTEAKNKARNTKMNQIALQYVKAFYLMTDGEKKNFPPTDTSICLGYGDEEECSPTHFKGSSTLNIILTNYYPAMPKVEDLKFSSTTGVLYRNIQDQTYPYIFWYIDKNFSCPGVATEKIVGGGNDPVTGKYCTYYFTN